MYVSLYPIFIIVSNKKAFRLNLKALISMEPSIRIELVASSFLKPDFIAHPEI